MSKFILSPEQQIRQRAAWFQEAERLGNVTVACRRCGISRKTFYKWRQRFAESRSARQALLDRPRRPHRPRQQVKKAYHLAFRRVRRDPCVTGADPQDLILGDTQDRMPWPLTSRDLFISYIWREQNG